eukprot:12913700-Prorocentrum_lima.AAC.1
MQANVVGHFQRMLSGHERFKHQTEVALMTSRQGEQQALINWERNEQFIYSEYQQSLVHCRDEMNQGVNCLQAEVTALQVLN